jgi:TonB family protein
VGPGDEADTGGNSFRVGNGVTLPRVIYQIDPEFSEEARKVKFQGNCVLVLIVDADGRPTNIRVLNALGMGLDERAIESVKNWKFEAGKKDGHNVAVEIACGSRLPLVLRRPSSVVRIHLSQSENSTARIGGLLNIESAKMQLVGTRKRCDKSVIVWCS